MFVTFGDPVGLPLADPLGFGEPAAGGDPVAGLELARFEISPSLS